MEDEGQIEIMDDNLKSHFLALYCMVLADGVIDDKELQAIYKIGTEDYGLRPEEILEAVSNNGSTYSVPDTLESKIKLLYDLAVIAWADGEIDPSEHKLLEKYVMHCGFISENASAIADYILESVKDELSITDILNQINQEKHANQ